MYMYMFFSCVRFRDTVLSYGGGRHPADVFVDFRGQKANVTSLLKSYGLVWSNRLDRRWPRNRDGQGIEISNKLQTNTTISLSAVNPDWI